MKTLRYRCSKCGLRFSAWSGPKGAQTHANESKHARVQMSAVELKEQV